MSLYSGLLISLITSTTIALAADDYKIAIHYYKTKHYAQASNILEKLASRYYPKSAKVHYYYANCLLKTSRKQEALLEYAKVVQLAPNSQVGLYSKRVLAFNHSYVKDNSHQDLEPRVAQSNTPNRTISSNSAAREIKKRMPIPPELVENYKVGVTLDKFRATGERNHLMTQEYLRAARRSHGQAVENLNRVRLMVSGMVPSQRKRGETESAFKARQNIYKEEIKKILAPYQDNVKETEDWMLEKEAIMLGRFEKRK